MLQYVAILPASIEISHVFHSYHMNDGHRKHDTTPLKE